MDGKPLKTGFKYPAPSVLPPLELPHLQTFIILHGRGDEASNFSRSLFHHPIPKYDTLRKAFPKAKFVIPTAPSMPAKLLNRKLITEWFDYWPFWCEGKDHDPEVDGLRASVQFIHALINKAADEVGPSRVVVGGLSQGCAAVLISMMLWQGPPIGAWFGMCGWLPFRYLMMDFAQEASDKPEDLDEPGETDDSAAAASNGLQEKEDLAKRVIEYMRDYVRLKGVEGGSISGSKGGPIFLAHGAADDNVPVAEGQHAHSLLSQMGFDSSWAEYENLGHWYSGEMLRDIVNFVRPRLELSPATPAAL
jgi:predicted esterase